MRLNHKKYNTVIQNRKVEFPKTKSGKEKVLRDALNFSFRFWIDKLQSIRREDCDKSFEEILKQALKDKGTHWTIYYRRPPGTIQEPYYEFGCCTMDGIKYFIWIQVRPDLAEKLIKKYKLAIFDY